MSELDAQFQQAAADAQDLTERPNNETLLKMYALYKQASSGDVDGKRPGFTNPVGRAKYDAWAEQKGTAQDDAKSEYIALIDGLKG